VREEGIKKVKVKVEGGLVLQQFGATSIERDL
jgi:hypothetical protein